MYIRNFTYLEPKTIEEALAMKANLGIKSSIIAGGTDLLIKMKHHSINPDFVIGLNSIPDLDYIKINTDNELVIGTMAKLTSIEESNEIKNYFPALAHSASVTATVQIRNMGTLVGNICNASPSADNATPLLAYDAKVVIMNQSGNRIVAMDEFFKGPGKSALETGEIVKEFILPVPSKMTGSSYQKVSTRSKVDIAGICVSALISLDKDGKIAKARIALGAVAPIPFRVYKAEELLIGKIPNIELLKEASKIAREESTPISDMRSSADYRKAMVEVLTFRVLEASIQSATKKKN
ncbi:MAG: hypothetical protein A2033_18940 [Bacteroidetes bacterium GWA2_31_9]|nr:MAG: hypothetical protein A2033_18940 [Bacteroidetes bacterium GWA2_31_9]